MTLQMRIERLAEVLGDERCRVLGLHAENGEEWAVADLAVLLSSDRFKYTTGDIITVDGGLPEAFPR